MSSPSVLLVEDNADDVLQIGRAWSRAAIDAPLSVVKDGEEAVRYLERAADVSSVRREPIPSLILLDVRLPGRSGLEVLEWIRKEPRLRRIPVVLLASSWDEALVARAYRLGANSCLAKPSGWEELSEAVRTLQRYWLGLNHPPERGSGA